MVAALGAAPAVAAPGDITLASTSDTGVKGNGDSTEPSLSADGTKVAFGSSATNLDPADTDSVVVDVYVKDLTTGDITLASTSDTGVKGNGDSACAVAVGRRHQGGLRLRCRPTSTPPTPIPRSTST